MSKPERTLFLPLYDVITKTVRGAEIGQLRCPATSRLDIDDLLDRESRCLIDIMAARVLGDRQAPAFVVYVPKKKVYRESCLRI